MARKRKPAADPDGILRGVSAYFVPEGAQPRRLQVGAPHPRCFPRICSRRRLSVLLLRFSGAVVPRRCGSRRWCRWGAASRRGRAAGTASTTCSPPTPSRCSGSSTPPGSTASAGNHYSPRSPSVLLGTSQINLGAQIHISARCIHIRIWFRSQSTVSFEWLEESIKAGQRLPEHKFTINYEEEFKPKKAAAAARAGDGGASNPAKRSEMPSEEDHKGTSGKDVKKEMPTGDDHKGTSEKDVKKEMPTEEDHKGTRGKDVKETPTEEHQDTSTHVHEGSAIKKVAPVILRIP
ncbi:unnamed protein product [Alopecurus aequalis]